MYKVLLSNGKIIDVPLDEAKTTFESISYHGVQAILERAQRAPELIEIRKKEKITIKAIIMPNGMPVTLGSMWSLPKKDDTKN